MKAICPEGLSCTSLTLRDIYNDRSFLEALTAKAAYLLFNIVTQHPFIDGNKRTAFACADIFLNLNDYFIEIDPKEGKEYVVKIALGKVNENQVRKWIAEHLRKL